MHAELSAMEDCVGGKEKGYTKLGYDICGAVFNEKTKKQFVNPRCIRHKTRLPKKTHFTPIILEMAANMILRPVLMGFPTQCSDTYPMGFAMHVTREKA